MICPFKRRVVTHRMNTRLRKPALAPPPIVVAAPWDAQPARQIERYFRRVFAERMAGLPFLNPALDVAVMDFQRVGGDWLGVVVTPWCLQLMLLPGRGTLWEDIPAGERRQVGFPAGTIEFIADAGESDLPAFQYCPLIAPVTAIADMASARQAAEDAMLVIMTPPAPRSESDPASPSHVPLASRRRFLTGRSGTG